MANPCGILMMNKHVQAFQKTEQMKSVNKFGKDDFRQRNSGMLFKKKKNFSCMSVATEHKMVQPQQLQHQQLQHNHSPYLNSSDMLNVGRMVKGGLVYRQNLVIRSFDIGFDGKVSLTSLMSYLQDTALNHGTMMGVLADGEDLGITKEMSRNNLIWVISSLQVVLDQYPSWLDVVEVETWMYPAGSNGLGHDWIIRDTITGQTVARATSVSVLMNKKTRKLSKMTKEIREEVASHIVHCPPILDKDTHKFPKLDVHTTDFVRTGLKPGWNDLDVNQHVNNTKYINWILESVPRSLMEHHQLSGVSLKFRRECNMDNELHSLSKFVENSDPNNHNQTIELEHLLRLDNGPEIVGGRTVWKPRFANNLSKEPVFELPNMRAC
ncbi:palmitoyl-acyl carrier protein thioesterase, chloroplastic-like [Euphorbia lathyris]|uniref:palmitoyl-acyl carrier protein thioesterase, chloroplastic-like n=1 Tax=Euphorbia lathyris TaxID=212925 RepID=UPI003313654D